VTTLLVYFWVIVTGIVGSLLYGQLGLQPRFPGLVVLLLTEVYVWQVFGFGNPFTAFIAGNLALLGAIALVLQLWRDHHEDQENEAVRIEDVFVTSRKFGLWVWKLYFLRLLGILSFFQMFSLIFVPLAVLGWLAFGGSTVSLIMVSTRINGRRRGRVWERLRGLSWKAWIPSPRSV
jgi:hypothetical protein